MKKIVLSFIMLLVVLLTACTTVEDDVIITPSDKVTISHTVMVGKNGNQNIYEQKIEDFKVNPKKVAIWSFAVLDMLDFVGFDKTGIQTLGLPLAQTPSYLEKYNVPTTFNIGTVAGAAVPLYENLDLMNPELIIIDGRSSSLYTDLSNRYPNADILDLSNTTYSHMQHRDIVTNLAKIFPNVGEELHNEMDQISLEFLKIRNYTTTTETIFLMLNGESVSISPLVDGQRFFTLVEDFGFINKNISVQPGDDAAHGVQLAKEGILAANPKVIFVMDRGKVATDAPGTFNEFMLDPLIMETQAHKDQMIFELDAQSWYMVSGGFRAVRQMISDINQFVAKVNK